MYLFFVVVRVFVGCFVEEVLFGEGFVLVVGRKL